MPIVSSEIKENSLQIDGRFRVVEKHLDEYGVEYLVTYLSDSGLDKVAAMLARRTRLYADRVSGEIGHNVSQAARLGSVAIKASKYSSNDQTIQALRDSYRDSSQHEAIMLGDALSSLADQDLRSIFSLPQPQVIALRANKLTPAATLATAVRNAVGE